MNFQSVVAGALASVFVVTSFWADAASANVRIVNDPGGEVSSYVLKFKQVRATITSCFANPERTADEVASRSVAYRRHVEIGLVR